MKTLLLTILLTFCAVGCWAEESCTELKEKLDILVLLGHIWKV